MDGTGFMATETLGENASVVPMPSLGDQVKLFVPWWKFSRELKRLWQQLRAIPEFFIEPYRQRRHDAERQSNLTQTSGVIPMGSRMALFLIYQPDKLADSTIWTCEHLVSKGYGLLVVSNHRLHRKDLERLVQVSSLVIERPNFGYDFGGYRDGIWVLQQKEVAIQHLLIINDSIWFPLQSSETLISNMEQSEAGLVGALQLDPLRQSDNLPKNKRPFLGSFLLMVNRSAWVHPAFKRFWETYRITSNKYKTIRRGERGFTHAMLDSSIACEAIYTRSMLDAFVQSLRNQDLYQLLTTLVAVDRNIKRDIDEALATFSEAPVWRTNALKIATAATEKQNILATAPITSLIHFQVPYLKKSADIHNLAALAFIQKRIVDASIPAAHESIMKEVAALLERKA